MKNIIKYVTVISFTLVLGSCSSDNELSGVSPGVVPPTIVDNKISIFDVNTNLSIDVETNSDLTINSVAVLKGSDKVADAPISGKTATFNSSTLLPFEFGDDKEPTGTFELDLDYGVSNGISGKIARTINVVNAISLTDEVSSIIVKDTASETNLVTYETFTAGATIDDIIVTWKNRKAGVETDISTGFDIDKGTIDLKDRDYIDYGLTVGDTLIYTFTVSSGSLTETVETAVEILPQPFNSDLNTNLSKDLTENQLDLSNGSLSADDAFDGDIDFIDPQGFGAINNTVAGENYIVDIQFVKLSDTGADFYNDYVNIEQAKVDFEAGIATSSVQVVKNEIYVYKITRTDSDDITLDHYGSILVGDVTMVNNEVSSIGITSKENSIIE